MAKVSKKVAAKRKRLNAAGANRDSRRTKYTFSEAKPGGGKAKRRTVSADYFDDTGSGK